MKKIFQSIENYMTDNPVMTIPIMVIIPAIFIFGIVGISVAYFESTPLFGTTVPVVVGITMFILYSFFVTGGWGIFKTSK